ncbi:DUF6377 domain-containing protein [Algibacter mikhailovii]|uniref:DUF6377 domain-containing protein n=1 Tax=Algibacter mikhailovii TaxID=425498 RepID=UPI002493D469|nr:DUF6377 domain-containing protein [Algibacter mikhailovii]
MYKTFLHLLFLFVTPTLLYSQSELDSLLVQLEKEMANREIYDQAKEQKIASLKALLSDESVRPENKYFVTNKLIKEYEYYSFDSTFHYIEKNLAFARNIDNIYFRKESALKLAKLLATSGRYKESLDLLFEIEPSNLPESLKKDYFFIYMDCYSQLRFYSIVEKTKQEYNHLFYAYRDSLQSQFEENTLDYLQIEEAKHRDNLNYDEALRINLRRLELTKSGTRDFSYAAFEHTYYLSNENSSERKEYLIKSAISDIQGSIKDNASLTSLSVMLFEEGDVDRAHNYIDFSFEDAKFYNSKLRLLNISDVLPVISKSFETKNLEQSKKLEKQLLFISILSLILIGALFSIFRQYKKIKSAKEHLNLANLKLKDLNEKLSITNDDLKRLYEELSSVSTIKEQYIGTFLNLYSDYIDKLDMYKKMVRKYIVTNKVNELLEITKSKKLIDDELKVFYSNFDKSFLHIYPCFIESLNDLLKEDEKIVVKSNEILNTELRIFALIRLGISNSSQISKILRYSVNTIYNYRVKVRNSAINRDEFEDMVKKIA